MTDCRIPKAIPVLVLSMACWAVPVSAQDVTTARPPTTANGQVGQRQSQAEVAPNVEPMGRIESRIQNRVQSRLRNRIDRFYSPQANTTSPFEVASDQARKAGQAAPR